MEINIFVILLKQHTQAMQATRPTHRQCRQHSQHTGDAGNTANTQAMQATQHINLPQCILHSSAHTQTTLPHPQELYPHAT